jgi:Ku protein
MAKNVTPKIGLRSSQKRTLRFGLVNVGISMAPALDASSRISAKLLDPESLTPLKQQYVNDHGDVVEHKDRVKGYAYGDNFVVLDDDEVPKAESSDVIDLVANVADTDVPSEWVDSTYLAWPQDTTQDQGYALVSNYLRSYGRAFIGTTVANGTTKVFALRWSEAYGTTVAQMLAFHAQVRWDNIDILREATEAIPAPDTAMADMAKTLFESAPSTFAWHDVADEYGERLELAVADKAKFGSVTPTAPATAPSPAGDLMAALAASLPNAQSLAGNTEEVADAARA